MASTMNGELISAWRQRRLVLERQLVRAPRHYAWLLRIRIKVLAYLISRYSRETRFRRSSMPARRAAAALPPGPATFMRFPTGPARPLKAPAEIRRLLVDIAVRVHGAPPVPARSGSGSR